MNRAGRAVFFTGAARSDRSLSRPPLTRLIAFPDSVSSTIAPDPQLPGFGWWFASPRALRIGLRFSC